MFIALSNLDEQYLGRNSVTVTMKLISERIVLLPKDNCIGTTGIQISKFVISGQLISAQT